MLCDWFGCKVNFCEFGEVKDEVMVVFGEVGFLVLLDVFLVVVESFVEFFYVVVFYVYEVELVEFRYGIFLF